MAFDVATKERIRYHLGYNETQSATGMFAGIPVPMQTAFMVESAMDRVINANAEERIKKILCVMDKIECALIESIDYFPASQLEGLSLRDNHPDKLEKEYRRWGYRLADMLMVPVYAFSTRYMNSSGAGNVPIS